MIVIIRVYQPGHSYLLRSAYKFITVGVIRRDNAYIYGMSNSWIGWRDLKAMDRQLFNLGVRMAHWSHNGTNHAYKLKG